MVTINRMCTAIGIAVGETRGRCCMLVCAVHLYTTRVGSSVAVI